MPRVDVVLIILAAIHAAVLALINGDWFKAFVYIITGAFCYLMVRAMFWIDTKYFDFPKEDDSTKRNAAIKLLKPEDKIEASTKSKETKDKAKN